MVDEDKLRKIVANAEEQLALAHNYNWKQGCEWLLTDLQQLLAESQRPPLEDFKAHTDIEAVLTALVKPLYDRLAALEHERDDWKEKHRLQGEAHRGDMRNALADLDKAEAALLSLREVLKVRGVHPANCPKGVGIGYYKPPADATCTCGIDAALLPDPAGTQS